MEPAPARTHRRYHPPALSLGIAPSIVFSPFKLDRETSKANIQREGGQDDQDDYTRLENGASGERRAFLSFAFRFGRPSYGTRRALTPSQAAARVSLVFGEGSELDGKRRRRCVGWRSGFMEAYKYLRRPELPYQGAAAAVRPDTSPPEKERVAQRETRGRSSNRQARTRSGGSTGRTRRAAKVHRATTVAAAACDQERRRCGRKRKERNCKKPSKEARENWRNDKRAPRAPFRAETTGGYYTAKTSNGHARTLLHRCVVNARSSADATKLRE